MAIALIIGLAVVWLGQATLLSWVMSRRGFHPLPWFAVSMLLGAAMWPLALVEALSGPPSPMTLRRGKLGDGALDVFVLFEDDHVPDRIDQELQRLISRCRRLVLARVIKAGGPTFIGAEAERFLKSIVSPLRVRDAELQLHFGDARRVLDQIEARGDVDIVLCSGRTRTQLDSEGDNHGERWIHDVPAA